ncbi:MAG TPA: WD40 repeat domain-containing protein, partial [Fimbriimonadaceae bacterium]|nr:WD40 repeat domain-containing protein [Fimbriimonadaceae bacterium]
RKSALTELERRNAELNRVSGERARAFTTLQQKNEDLTETTRQRERALEDLRKSISERTYVAYLGQMGTVIADQQSGRMNRLLDIAKATRDNPNRGWEWGSLAKGVGLDAREVQFPRWSVIEPQPSGDLNVVTSEGIYSIADDHPKLIQTFPYRRPNTSLYRRGPFRVKAVENPRGFEIDDAATGKTLIPARSYAMIYDVEPKRRLYLLAQGMTLDVIQLRTIDGDKLVASYKGPADSDCAKFLPDGSILSSFSTEKDSVGEVHRWDQTGKKISHTVTDQQYARGISISGDGKLYAVWGFNVKLAIRNVSDHKVVRTIPDQPRLVSAVALSRDGSKVIVGGDDAGIRLYGDDPVRNLSFAYGFRSSLSSVVFTNNEKGFAGMDSGGTLRVWPIFPESWNLAYTVPGFTNVSGAFGGDSETLIHYSNANEAISRNIRTRVFVRKAFDTREASNTVQVFDGISALFVGRSNGALDRYDGKTLNRTASLRIFKDKVSLVERFPNKDSLLIGSSKKQFALVDAKTLRVRSRINLKLVREAMDSLNNPIDDAVAFDAESDQFALYIGEIGKIHVFSAATGKLLKEWPERRAVRAMQFASGGRELIVSFGAAWFVQDGETWVYNVKTGERRYEFKHPLQTVGMMRYAPKTRVLAAGTRDREEGDRVVFLYDMRTRNLIGELRMEPFINWFNFSPDGERLLAWSGNGITRLWDARTAQEVYQLRMGGRTDFVDGGRRILQLAGETIRVHNTLPWTANGATNR